ncbi:hypothetical protein BKI52_08525 [marine bacterium AO1-C]|nr:hypothetical protein BKI52_08525 [marine bacterium AO1-C]
MKYYTYILFFIFLHLFSQLFGQSPHIQQITDRDGLPSMVVYDVKEDSKGYLWLGTEAGIVRYDGVHFQTFQVSNAQGKSFTTMQEDSKGRMYFINFSGQLFYFFQGETHQVLLPDKLQKQDFQHYIIDQEDRIWITGKAGGLYVGNPYTQKWQYIEGFSSNKQQKLYASKIFRDAYDRIWLLSYKSLIQVGPQLNLIQTIRLPQNYLYLTFTKNEIIFSTYRRRFSVYNLETTQWRPVFEDLANQEALISGTYRDPQGNIWVMTNQGTHIYSPQYRQKLSQTAFLKNKFVSNIVQDREGNYWFTTLGNGIFKMPNKDILHFQADNSELKYEQINDLEEDARGNLFIATNGNQVFYFDTQKQKITQKYRLPEGDIESMLWDESRQRLYVENGELLTFDMRRMKVTDNIFGGNTSKSLSLYQNKYLIVASGGSGFISPLGRTSPAVATDVFPDFDYSDFYRTRTLRGKRSRTVLTETNQLRFWIGYSDGLFFYENNKQYELKTPDQQAIIALNISQDANGVVWVGTAQQGIFAIKNKHIIQHLDVKQGLISNYCKRIFKEGDYLYIGTEKGLQVYHLQTKQSRVFDQSDGLPSNEIRDLVVQKDKIYLATAAGLSVLKKNFNTTNYIPPLIYITGLSLQNNPQKLQPQYELAYNENNLTIYFTGIAFRSGGKFTYKYRMQGLDEQWSYSNSTNNLARYSALPSGEYQFQVKTINEDGIESEKTATINIDIAYPIWEKWWFITLMTLLVLALITTIAFFRVRAYQRKMRLENAFNKAALESLQLQMNPHFIFNAMGAIQHYIVTNDSKNASIYLAKFSRLMRAVLENSRQEYICLDEEIDMLENYLVLQNLRHEGSFEYQVTIDDQLDPEMITIPPMFAQPFIENAIEHGIAHLKENGLITIDFSLQQDVIVLKITDNGRGIEDSLRAKAAQTKEHRSLATIITKERIALYQQSLKKNITFKVKSLDQGTQVIFHLPYQQT